MLRLTGLLLLLAVAPASSQSRPKPNLVVLLCDDLGYGDLGPDSRTPHLQRLAAEGTTFTQFYAAAPVCSPSRAGLLTGRVPNRLGIRDWIPEGSGIYLRPRELTLPQLLRKAGYRTCHVGKWHLNSRVDGSEPSPRDAGFEHGFYTQNNAAPSHLDPVNFVRNGAPAGAQKGPSSHVVVDEAIRWLEGVNGEPFFLNVWFHEPHEPVAAADEYLALHEGEPNPDRRHYLGCISQMDAAVGRLLKRLDELGHRDRTMVLFTSDNGPETLNRYKAARRSHGSPGPLRGMKLHVTEAGIRVPGLLRFPGRAKPGSVIDEPVGGVDLLPTACALAGIELPKDRVLDGANLLPLLEGKPMARPHPLYWQYDFALSRPWALALRDGPWKLLADGKLERFALHRMDSDVHEDRDLSEAEPERLKSLAETLKRLHAEIESEGASSGNPLPRKK